ncbi:hypothetical protein BGZ95_002366 [Linnemannia exigua]|uniref:Uncharacterized protein n=1 Tax=Linnemannia exigua TaxID=604196 RepID=A0AAD4DLU7_9FUNG|nr:hypothetical protein BGZ95_002366 [Linnemannia exigua]
MQALTPLLFAMLFPRFSNSKNDSTPDAEGHDTIESLLNGHRNSTSSELSPSSPSFFSFGEGYPVDEYSNNSQEYHSAKVRRHHSTGALIDSAQSNNSNLPRNTNIRRNNTVPQVRRASGRPQPQRLSIDHAAFIATYPSLDGLGDMGYRSSSSLDYYRNNNNTANTANNSNNNSSTSPRSPRSKASSSKLRKQQSQETLPSRASTSSIASMVSDASSSSSSSVASTSSSAREPLTPTKTSNYHSIHGTDASSLTTKKSKRASLPVTIVRPGNNKSNLIALDSVAQEEQENDNKLQAKSMLCQSPQSDNFFSTEESFAGSAVVASEGIVKARGQRQLIAH